MSIISFFQYKKKHPSNTLTVHPDIKNLLWIKNGKDRNKYTIPAPKPIICETAGMRLTFSFGLNEPSLIDVQLPVSFERKSEIPEPGYYPSYERLTPQQRGLYWDFLKAPYDRSTNISYVFILYYGLERHLYQKDFENAVEAIFKLRSVHKAPSFQYYSSNALMFTGIFRKRPDIITRLYDESMSSSDTRESISPHLLLLCKLGFNDLFTAEEIMHYARLFGYTNTKNIREYPDIFLHGLRDTLLAKYSYPGIYIADYVNKNNISLLDPVNIPIFANWSIEEREAKIQSVSSCPALREAVCSSLKEANEYVKNYKKEQKKKGMAVSPTSAKKQKHVRKYDDEKENCLLKRLKEATDPVALHYAYMNLHEFYYTYRDTSPDYLESSKTYALKDQEILSKTRKYYINEENRKMLTWGNLNKDEDEDMANIDFCYVVPSFTRLSVIYEKEGDLKNALKICDNAVKFYSEVGHKDELTKFVKKRDRIKKKLNDKAGPF